MSKNGYFLYFIILVLTSAADTARADYGWWDFIGLNPPDTVGKYPTAERACQVAVSKIWYRGKKEFTHHVMADSGDYATCHVRLQACNTCQWETPSPPYWIDGQTIAAIRKGTPCRSGTSYDVETGECFIDQRNNQGETPGTCATPTLMQGNPIAISNGNKFQKEVYFHGSDKFPVKLELVYNSIDKRWRHSYSTSLHHTDTSLIIVFADGRSARYNKDTGMPLDSSETSQLVLLDGHWVLKLLSGDELTFNRNGRLQRWKNLQGEAVELQYGSPNFIRLLNNTAYGYKYQIININSRTEEMQIEERDDNRLHSASIGSKQFYFTWDTTLSRINSASLILPSNSSSATRHYHYEDPYGSLLLTGATDERGVRYASWAYDSQGRAVVSEHANGADKIEISYNPDGSRTVANALGKTTTYHFIEVNGIQRISAIEGEPSPNCPNSNSTFTYDDRGLLKTKTDNKGNVTTYDYNERGLEVSRREASGTPEARTITTVWHPTLFLPVTVTEPDQITNYTYDVQGRQLSQTVTAR